MIRQPHTSTREMIVANAVREVASELRLVDLVDYIAYIRLEHFSTIADIVDTASELFFLPGTLRFGHAGEADVDWAGDARITLDMELKPAGATVYFTLQLTDRAAAVNVNYVAFDESTDDPEQNSRFLEAAIASSMLKRAKPRDATERFAAAP